MPLKGFPHRQAWDNCICIISQGNQEHNGSKKWDSNLDTLLNKISWAWVFGLIQLHGFRSGYSESLGMFSLAQLALIATSFYENSHSSLYIFASAPFHNLICCQMTFVPYCKSIYFLSDFLWKVWSKNIRILKYNEQESKYHCSVWYWSVNILWLV